MSLYPIALPERLQLVVADSVQAAAPPVLPVAFGFRAASAGEVDRHSFARLPSVALLLHLSLRLR